LKEMVRAAILVTVLAVLASALCFGSCVTSSCAQPSGSCHHNQKKTVEPCGHRPLVADEAAQSAGHPLMTLAPVPLVISVWTPSRPQPAPPALSPSPPLLTRSLTILKI
jgi:hypothetical protein